MQEEEWLQQVDEVYDKLSVQLPIYYDSQRVVKGIFVTRDWPFFFLVKREMANFFFVNRDFHSSCET